MGLDLTISVQSDFNTDEQGRNTYKVTQLVNLRNCHAVLNQLDNRLEFGFSNGATYTFYGETFHEILEELTESVETSEYAERERISKECNIKKLEKFITENNVPNDDTQDYQVHAWW